ncbi:NADPH-dependent 7-cyano-7-deazaguanine reductase QueF [Neptunomonas qingdaonensis]|uniref:NADPH-dependent 7-cyano-7-deazaguanine reductase n=1 Tax=Neptunomonas qingdaonensis TaxID=1045558 RepID=A0A1I2NVP9_9GAMM|nr:NADPH-dependent 7-cyano-7-deazaguanine reductase QueF [Neptunomonas qingdaonensis]SFG07613.1 7-cyano-7-deazaguanine reductase [Neptunomonas qingdaonensis]
MTEQKVLDQSPLGSDTAYVNQYSPQLLFPIQRDLNWHKRGIERADLPFYGEDLWNGYEISWLNLKGKPVVRIAAFVIPADSRNIIESKSFKLYLNSFNLSRFENEEAVIALMQNDLSLAAGGDVRVEFFHPDGMPELGRFEGKCLDELDISVTHYQPEISLLSTGERHVDEMLYSHLLKSNCPVTGQPDWASIQISYVGKEINQEGLLEYLISYREHGDFHEQCVENIFMDIWTHCQPESLIVYARYVRRGGLDINPLRSSKAIAAVNLRLSRQ